MATEIQRLGAQTAAQFNDEVRRVIRDVYARGANDVEFLGLMTVAEARGLDPRIQQCYFVNRWDSKDKRKVWSVQVSIDGLRSQAERTGEYDGQDEPEFVEKDGRVISAKVRVYRKGISRPFVGVAYFDEYVQKTNEGEPTRFWKTMPHGQLAKCAEALALRKAFPATLGGLYTTDEMAQAENDRAAITSNDNAPEHQPEHHQLSSSNARQVERRESPSIQRMRDDLKQLESPTIEQVVAIWMDHEREVTDEAGGAVETIEAAQDELLSHLPVPMKRNEFHVHVRTAQYSERHPEFKAFMSDVNVSKTLKEFAGMWKFHSAALGQLGEHVKEHAWTVAGRTLGVRDPSLKQPGKALRAFLLNEGKLEENGASREVGAEG